MGLESTALGIPSLNIAWLLYVFAHVSRVIGVDTPLDTIKHDLKTINTNINTFKGKQKQEKIHLRAARGIVF